MRVMGINRCKHWLCQGFWLPPGKRAPTVKLCESDEHYVPLNDGAAWKGDPNATLSGQGSPEQSTPPGPPPVAAAWYDPSTGSYVGPDGRV
jgi:phospholipid/cholesterol/gamma-HCH transport system substrate-binding protein